METNRADNRDPRSILVTRPSFQDEQKLAMGIGGTVKEESAPGGTLYYIDRIVGGEGATTLQGVGGSSPRPGLEVKDD